MVNKKAWIRIVEASIAIMIILAVILTVSQTKKRTAENDLSNVITPILDEIAKNVTFREAVINDNNASYSAEEMLIEFLRNKIKNPGIGYGLKICAYMEACGLEAYPADARGSIYAEERVISSTLTSQGCGPRKVVIFLWLKE